jgi:hypothetical protein
MIHREKPTGAKSMTTEPLITCPNCGTDIELTEALAAPLHAKLEAAHRAEIADVQAQLRREADARVDALVKQAARKAREDASLEKQVLERELVDERERRKAAQQAELDLRKEKTALEHRARELDLEVMRRLDCEKKGLEEAIRRSFAEQHDLKLKEKEKLIDDLRRALEDARRKSEQGSQERQGEVLEIDVQAELERRFPHDAISPVPKGARGADLIHEVRAADVQSQGNPRWKRRPPRVCQGRDIRSAFLSLAAHPSSAAKRRTQPPRRRAQR